MRFPKNYIEHASEAVANPDLDYSLTFEEFVAACMNRDVSKAIENCRRKHPEWPHEWLEGYARLRRISDGNRWLIRGVARRILASDVDELQLFLEMHVRSRFHWYYKNHDEYIEVWSLLDALAIDDCVTINRHLEFATFPLTNSQGGEAARLFNAVHQLLREPSTQLKDLDLRTTKSCASWLRACLEFIAAVAQRSQEQAQAALASVLSGYRRTPQINLMEKAIAFCAHGLLRLCERTAPELALEVSASPSLPWDEQLHRISTGRQIVSRKHFPGVPPWLIDSIVELNPLPWQTVQ
ncbi:hypothetical protein [Rubripirellula lacrimiformis]|nr:hypothetical protein [Rubripirellula lacrimiformis]